MFNWFKREPKPKPAQSQTIAREYNVLIAGVDYAPNGVALVRQLRVGDEVLFVREPDNLMTRTLLQYTTLKGSGSVTSRLVWLGTLCVPWTKTLGR